MQHSPKPFEHPEFVEYPEYAGHEFPFRSEMSTFSVDGVGRILVYASKEGHANTQIMTDHGLATEFFTKGDVVVITAYSGSGRLKQIRVAGELVKQEVRDLCVKDETWFETVNGKSEIKAIRRFRGGLLSDSANGPAVIIRTFNPCAERHESWENGVLKKVEVVNSEKILYSEIWEGGKCLSNKYEDFTFSFPYNVLALMNASHRLLSVPIRSIALVEQDKQTPQPAPEPSSKKVEIITAKQVRELYLTVDEVIQTFNEYIKKNGRSGIINLRVGNVDILAEVKTIIKNAGYEIDEVFYQGQVPWLCVKW